MKPEPRPRATLAVLGYNSETYVREAIEGAFVQDCDPIEIILSDDCSTDRTFEIMQRAAAVYRGRHTVLVRRNPQNLGVLRHVFTVAESASGEILVLAAGDDVSECHRVTTILDRVTPNVDAVTSSFSEIDEDGAIMRPLTRFDYEANPLWHFVAGPNDSFVGGATSAYRRSFLIEAKDLVEDNSTQHVINNEDMVLTAALIAMGRSILDISDIPLVRYRMRGTSLSNYRSVDKSWNGIREGCRFEKRAVESRLGVLSLIVGLSERFPSFSERVNHSVVRDALRIGSLSLEASSPSAWIRVGAVTRVRSVRELRTWVVRVSGEDCHAALRYAAARARSAIQMGGRS